MGTWCATSWRIDATRATETIISKPSSKIEVRVIPTNEELVIARNAWAKLQESH